MNEIIKQYINSKKCSTNDDYVNALREVLQNIILIGLKNSGFFKKAAFYGGTALRIFYGLDRYSEDLDFTLLDKDEKFSFDFCFPWIKSVAASYGFNVELVNDDKIVQTNVVSAFLKTDTKLTFLSFEVPSDFSLHLSPNQKIKIKFEVDNNPALGFNYESKAMFFPEQSMIATLDAPSLFAGKIAAILCRNYKNRVKGRDYYDYLFYISRGIQVNLNYLKSKIIESNKFNDIEDVSSDVVKKLLVERFNSVDINMIKKDLEPFLSDLSKINNISKDFLMASLDLLSFI